MDITKEHLIIFNEVYDKLKEQKGGEEWFNKLLIIKILGFIIILLILLILIVFIRYYKYNNNDKDKNNKK